MLYLIIFNNNEDVLIAAYPVGMFLGVHLAKAARLSGVAVRVEDVRAARASGRRFRLRDAILVLVLLSQRNRNHEQEQQWNVDVEANCFYGRKVPL
jgi:hypothetical protein